MMRRVVFLMALAMALATTESETNAHNQRREEEASPAMVTSHFLLQHHTRTTMTCNKFPRICHTKGSPGHDCCKKRCVNVKTDNLNCGKCGKRCRYGWACCSGKCVSVMYDRSNCGGCKKRCKKGSFCRYGMCSYAD